MARLGRASALSPSARLLALLLFSSACLSLSTLAAGMAALCLVILIIGEGIPPGRLLRESSFLLWIAAFTFLVQGMELSRSPRMDRSGMAAATAYSARLLAAFFAGRLFYAATSRAELRDLATRAGNLLPGRAKGDAGLALYLVLGFLTLIVEEWRSSLEAAKARGMPARPGLSRGAILVASYLRRLMLMALCVPEALAARGWSGARIPRPCPWSWFDFAVCGAVCLLLILSLFHIV